MRNYLRVSIALLLVAGSAHPERLWGADSGATDTTPPRPGAVAPPSALHFALVARPTVFGSAGYGRAAEPPSRPEGLPRGRVGFGSQGPLGRRAVRWYHVGAGLGVIGLASLADETVRDELQADRTAGKDDVARVFRQMGEPEIYASVGLGTIAVGLISGDDRITRAGGRITGTLLVAGGAVTALKLVVGRMRPRHTDDAYRFRPFSKRDAWPSGHATMAFALAASVSDEVRSTPVTVALYGAATLTAWSRLNDNRHWLSDVLAGAAVGVTTAKLMNGRWRVLGISGPRFLLGPDQVGISAGF